MNLCKGGRAVRLDRTKVYNVGEIVGHLRRIDAESLDKGTTADDLFQS
jgi:hypothetical protein